MNTQNFKNYSSEILSEIMKYEYEITLLNETVDNYHSKIKKLSHKRRLMNLYIKKIEEIDEDITLKDLMTCIINEIAHDKHTEADIDLLLNTKVDNMHHIKTFLSDNEHI